MKILYLGNDTESIGAALRGIQEGVTVLKGSHHDQAAGWLEENPDIAALVVEAQLDGGDWRSVLTHFGALAVRPAVVVVVPEGTGPLFESLEPGADGYIEKGHSLVRELPGAVTRAVAHARGLDLEQQLARATVALEDAERRHLAAMAEATARIAQRQAQYEIAVARASAIWEMVDEQLRAAALQVERARHSQASADAEADRLRHRDAEISSRLADAEAAAEATSARAEQERAAAADLLAERQRELQAGIAHESEKRRGVEDALALAMRAQEESEKRHESAMAGASARVRELEEALGVAERDLESTAADVERLTKRAVELSSTLDDVTTGRNELEHRLAATEAAFRDADTERLAASKRGAAREAELDGEIRTEREARTALEQALADADAALRDAQQRHETALAAAAAGVERLTERLERSEAAADADIRRLTAERSETGRVLEETERRLRDLQTEVEEVPRLRQLVDEDREKSRRSFQQAGLAMFRCTRDGAFVEANRACKALIGQRMFDELRGAPFAGAVFEAPDVLPSLIERCVGSTTARVSADTTWRQQDGRRLFVRVSASVAASDLIEITAEDQTRLRVLEERLNKAHRMEAVGRLASEVAATCGNLLDNIHQNAQEWLMTAGDAASRHHGERLLDDAARAAGLLRQLATCGEEQARTPRLVDVNTLVRDLEPVLKRVAGDDVDIQLRDAPSPLNVDVGIERVERLFVNLASYGRERMPFGGRLTIELGTVVVDRHFGARHPDVRLGLHALITVTETRRAPGADGPYRSDRATERRSQGSAEARPGVDFGTLQELVSECGGHLWVKVQPPGDMIAKIRLPLLSGSHDETGPNARGAGVRAIARRFRP